MKMAVQQLEQHLTQSLAPIYFISGDETLLVQEAVDLVRSSAQKKGFSERIRITAESNAEWGKSLYANAHSFSLFAEQRILELDLRNAKFNQANTDILQSYAENPIANTLLLIYSGKLETKTTQSKWCKAIDKNGITLPIWPVTIEQLPQWIMQRAKKSKLSLTTQAASRLAQYVEGNLLAAAQEIEKLSLLQSWDESTLEEWIADQTHFDIFQLVDAVLSGNNKRSLHILKNLFAEGIEPTLILWVLTRELTTMAEIHQHTQQGVALSTLFTQFRIWEKRQALVRGFLKRSTPKLCWDALLHAAQVDRMIKGVEVGHVRDELERLVLSLTTEPRP